jgi:hypothetical protein
VLGEICPSNTSSAANGKWDGLRLIQDLFDNMQVSNHLLCRGDGGEKPVQITGARLAYVFVFLGGIITPIVQINPFRPIPSYSASLSDLV